MLGDPPARWLRRARPALGTLVEVGINPSAAGMARDNEHSFSAAYAAITEVQSCLSRFDPASDIARFNAAPQGARISVSVHTRRVLRAARSLHAASDGAFDVTLASAPRGWRCMGGELHKLDAAARIDLGGIGKGYAVDCAVESLIESGCESGWINAGGDLRVFGDCEQALSLRDETHGGVRPFATLRRGAFATSDFGPRSRCPAAATRPVAAHVSVAAPLCLWADALTKIVAISGDASHPLLHHHGARAWLHS
ncbi:MAG: FAD:protein FMN transferase [Burkholderiales bacterium]